MLKTHWRGAARVVWQHRWLQITPLHWFSLSLYRTIWCFYNRSSASWFACTNNINCRSKTNRCSVSKQHLHRKMHPIFFFFLSQNNNIKHFQVTCFERIRCCVCQKKMHIWMSGGERGKQLCPGEQCNWSRILQPFLSFPHEDRNSWSLFPRLNPLSKKLYDRSCTQLSLLCNVIALTLTKCGITCPFKSLQQHHNYCNKNQCSSIWLPLL